ncbi:acyl-CoA synthetase [Lichenicola cladoniae]|uniref:Acyl-CoA synthetase n=1 Tax=Lichenicola cladoniae TaxID=1484109 RepID=A0A6M8HRW5_9PROT|nr:AMP-binding protein [Lichenicola cladoniae]NPD65750.1 acyl-CoA synthetase [Acetobacteraceae bacterium]QKE91233.1 acyl-CoA synthetase [Lichenicola cladoniae]
MTGIKLVARPETVLFRTHAGPLTGYDLLRAAHRLAVSIPAGPVINLCRDRSRFTVALLAALLRNETSLLVSDRSPERLRWLLNEHPGAIIVTDTGEFESRFPHHRLSEIPCDFPGNENNPEIPLDRLVAIVFTSGSTGAPVAHEKRWGELVQRSRAAIAQFGLLQEDQPETIVGTIPPQHMYGFETTVLLPLHTGVASMSVDGFYPADIRQALTAAPAPRVLVTTPLQLRALVESGITLSPLRMVISATAPLAVELASQAETRWNSRVQEIYGATEIGSIASRRTVSGDIWTLYPGIAFRPGSDGRTEVVAPPATPHPISDMIETTGLDGADLGGFRLLGRPGDLLKFGGKRASLAGLNAILNSIPGILDGVFHAPDDTGLRLARRMQVFVVSPTRSADDLLAELRSRIDPAFLPRRVVMLDALPRNEVGKITREALVGLHEAAAQPACSQAS